MGYWLWAMGRDIRRVVILSELKDLPEAIDLSKARGVLVGQILRRCAPQDDRSGA
jgi:hypothetical protein